MTRTMTTADAVIQSDTQRVRRQADADFNAAVDDILHNYEFNALPTLTPLGQTIHGMQIVRRGPARVESACVSFNETTGEWDCYGHGGRRAVFIAAMQERVAANAAARLTAREVAR